MTTTLLSRTPRSSRSALARLSALPRRGTALAAAAVLAFGLTACSSDDDDPTENSAAAQSDIDAALSELNTPDEDRSADTSNGDTANDPGAPQITADRTVDLNDGDDIAVTVRHLDTSAGYYIGICKAATGADAAGEGTPPDCTGDRSSSKWVTAEDSDQGTDHFDAEGTAEVQLTVAEKGDAVDCATDKCTLKVFGDHQNGFRNVGDAPVTFAH